MLGSLDGTSLAIETLRRAACLSLVFGLVGATIKTAARAFYYAPLLVLGGAGYVQDHPVEKWMRDAKINDIFEGTQQIQLLIIARQLLGKTSAELR